MGKFFKEIEKGFFHHLGPGRMCSPGHLDGKMTHLGLRSHHTNVWQFSLPIEGKGRRMSVFMVTFHSNRMHFTAMGDIAPVRGCFHCCLLLTIIGLSVVTIILFPGKYTSATRSYMVAVVFLSNRQLLSVQIAPVIKQKENVMQTQFHPQRSPGTGVVSFPT